MSCTLFLFISLFFDFACYSDFYCIFVPYLCRDKKVDNVQQKYKCSKITRYKLLYASCKI